MSARSRGSVLILSIALSMLPELTTMPLGRINDILVAQSKPRRRRLQQLFSGRQAYPEDAATEDVTPSTRIQVSKALESGRVKDRGGVWRRFPGIKAKRVFGYQDGMPDFVELGESRIFKERQERTTVLLPRLVSLRCVDVDLGTRYCVCKLVIRNQGCMYLYF